MQLSDSFVDIVVPVHNGAGAIGATLGSVVAQYGVRKRCIVVDDASTDNTFEVVRRVARANPLAKIVYVKNPQRRGLASSLNVGIAYSLTHSPMSSSEVYIAMLHSADEMVRDRLRIQATFLDNNPTVGVIASEVDKKASSFRRQSNDRGILTSFRNSEIRASLPFGNPISHTSVMMRRELFDEVSYDSDLPGYEDYGLWVDLIDTTEFCILSQPLTVSTVASVQSDGDNQGPAVHRQSLIRVLRALLRRWGIPENYLLPLAEMHVSGRRSWKTHRVYQHLLENDETLGLDYQTLYRRYYEV